MESRTQVDANDRVPFFRREVLDLLDMLDSGIGDDGINAAEFRFGGLHQVGNLVGLEHVRAVKDHLAGAKRCQTRPRRLYFVLLAQPVENDVVSGERKILGNSKADPAGRSGDDDGFHGNTLS